MARVLPILLLVALVASCDSTESFYEAPAHLPSGPMGSLLKLEAITPFTPGTRAYRVLYLSTGVDGEPVAVSGLLGVPASAAPAAGYDVVSWAHGTTGIADACAPSTGRRFNHDAYDVAPVVLAEGWVFVATDYEGLGTAGMHRYLIGDSEARGILDSVRAAGFLDGITLSGRVAFWGRSQGGHAGLFAGELAPSYAPELTVVGTVVGAPASELASAFPLSGYLGGRTAAYNWDIGYSYADAFGFDLDAFYDAYTRSRVDGLLAEGGCLPEMAALGDELGSAGFDVSQANDPRLIALLEESSPGHRRQGAPVRIHQGLADEDVPAFATDSLVDALCAAGDPIEYVTYPGENHVQSTQAHVPEMVAFTRDRFDGVAFTGNCP